MLQTERSRRRSRLLRGFAVSCLATWTVGLPVAAAEIVYVTDELRLGLYDSELTSGRPFKTLISGAELTVLERSLMSIRVRTEEGDEGWVKTAYIVDTEPGRRRAERLEAANAGLSEEKSALTTSLAAAEARIDDLESEVAAANAGIAELPQLREDHEALKAQVATRDQRVPLAFAIAGAALTLVIGGIGGYWWLDRRVRSHFGGIRPY